MTPKETFSTFPHPDQERRVMSLESQEVRSRQARARRQSQRPIAVPAVLVVETPPPRPDLACVSISQDPR